MSLTFPRAPAGRQLGVGLDLPWGTGFVEAPTRGEVVRDDIVVFLERHAGDFGHLFVSWQPKHRGVLDACDYFPAYDDLFARVGSAYPVRALHQTALNLGALEPYDRGAILDLTSALVERYAFAWVNEDVGLWSIHGKPLPYPLAPYLTASGLRAAIANTRTVQDALRVPLLVEFPGFSDGTALVIGRLHAYDFFRTLAEESGVGVTLDTGHLLSYQWLRGRRGEALFEDLDRLPLERCFEIHLSGGEVKGGRFHDRHHGVLLPEQLELLRRLIPLCPNARAVTYEDPVFDDTGEVPAEARGSLEALRAAARGWAA
ncbi:hypothetical protein BH11MYX4_BH11MYX4_04520 [soil metagenome]